MQAKFWLRLFNVRKDESKLVNELFWMQFFQGAGLAFFSTAAYTLFLHKFSVSELPLELAFVFVYSAFFLWLTGFVYSRLEHRVDFTRLAGGIILFMAGSMFLFRIGFFWFHEGWYYLAMLVWFTVLYLLSNLEFWGIASVVFDVRQSKRLFGLISAGDIPAKFIGYLTASLVVKVLGPENLLWIGIPCILYSYRYLYLIEKSGKMQISEHKNHPKPHVVVQNRVSTLVKHITGNRLIRRIALLSVIVSACFIIINYSFYTEVKKRFETDVQLAQFISTFLAIVSFAALVLKMTFTGRLLNRLGITRSLLITPLIMIILISILLTTQYMSQNAHLIFYIFGASAILIDISRISINNPVFLTLMQPLGTHERLRAHTIVKGIMDPFAFLLTGILMLLFIRFQNTVTLADINFFLFSMGILWVIGVFRIYQEYLKTLVKTISSRYFGAEELPQIDRSAYSLLEEKIKNGNELELMYLLKMLDSQHAEDLKPLVLKALRHPSPGVKIESIRLISRMNIQEGVKDLYDLLGNSGNSRVIAASILALCQMSIDEEKIITCLSADDRNVRKAAITGLLLHGKENARSLAATQLEKLAYSSDTTDRKSAAEIMAELPGVHSYTLLQTLMNDTRPEIRASAIHAAGRLKDPDLLRAALKHLPVMERGVQNALIHAGNSSLPVIRSFILENEGEEKQTRKLIACLGLIGGHKVHSLLLELLDLFPAYSGTIIKALYRSHYSVPHQYRKHFEQITRQYLGEACDMLWMQKRLDPGSGDYAILMNSLSIELEEIREIILCLFACMYNRENINKARAAMGIRERNTQANAFELIELTVRRDYSQPFNTLYESTDIEHRCESLKSLFPGEAYKNVEKILNRILGNEEFDYSHWTKACSLYTGKKNRLPVDSRLIVRYRNSADDLLKETAGFASIID